MNEFFLIIDIDTANWSWNICELKDLLGSRLGRVEMLLGGLTTQDRDCQPN